MKNHKHDYQEPISRHAVAAFFALLLVVFWAVTRVELLPDGRFEITSPHVIAGDEPHYLMVLNSILFDHDLELQDDYDRAAVGLDAGGIPLPDHHTILINRRLGKHGTWADNHWDPDLSPGPDVYEVSSHPMAYPALLAVFLFPFHPKMEDVQRDASLVMVLISWLGAIVTFLLARKVGMGRGDALFATALLALASPWLAYARSFFVEPVIGLTAAVALWALEGERPLLAGGAAAAAAIFKPPFALIGGGFAIDRIQRKLWRDLIELVSVLSVCALALVAFNYWLARTPIISGNVSGALSLHSNTAKDFSPLRNSFIGGAHGLIIWAPWTIFAIFSIGLALFSVNRSPGFLHEMSLPIAMQVVIVTASNFGSGACYGPRYWVPYLPWMAVAAVHFFRSTGRIWKVALLLLVAVSIPISIAGALRYPQMFSRPPWFLWHVQGLQR